MPAKPSTPNSASAPLLTTCAIFLLVTGIAFAESNGRPQGGAAAKAVASDTYAKLPLSFEPNEGQTDQQVKFLSRGPGYALFLTPAEAVFTLRTPNGKRSAQKSLLPISAKPFEHELATKYSVLRIGLEHANSGPRISGTEELPGKSNYFVGKDPKNWHSNIPTYRKVKYSGVYPGIDLAYYGNQRQLEYDFVVAPGADPNVIGLKFTGARRLSIDKDGDLVAQLRGGKVIEHAPVIYQEIDGVRRPVAGGYRLRRDHTVGFKLAGYDRHRSLTIDPSLVYSTYLGGSSSDFGQGIAVDSSGNAYVTGYTFSSNFPTTAGALHGGYDAFVSKLNSGGSALLYSTYLGGSDTDVGQGIAVDSSGNAYVTGYTFSNNFPTVGAPQTTSGGGADAFVSKLNSDGSALVYSTYLGGFNFDFGQGIAVDSSGNAYVAGQTNSSNFPTTTGALQKTSGGGADAFVSKLNSSGSALVYSTYLGGSDYDFGQGIAVDSSGNAYVTGYTFSNNFPTTLGALQTTGGGSSMTGADAFVSKLTSTGSVLVYSTYLGGSSNDAGQGIAVDSSGNAYVTGRTGSSDFPTTTSALQTTSGGGADAFVSKLNSGSALAYSTYLGGSSVDSGQSIAVDSSGNAYVTGYTYSSNFPTTAGAFQTTFGGAINAFVSKLNSSGSALVYSTYLGGSITDVGLGIAVDASGSAYVTGYTYSSNFPTTAGALQTTFSGGCCSDAFVSKFASPPTITITSPTNTTYEINQPVAASYTCTNADNSVSTCTGPVSSGSNIDTSTLGSKSFTVNATDSHGNSSSATVNYTVVASSLTISLTVPANRTTYTLNESVPSAYTCSDPDEAVTACTGTTANGANIDTSSVGNKSFTVNATDAYNNSIGQSVNYTVDYNIFPLYDSTHAVTSGAVIPIKLQLNDTAGIDVSSSSIVVHATGVVMVSTNASQTLQSPGSSSPDTDFRFDPKLGTTGGYIFNLSTQGYPTGTYLLNFTAGNDPTTHSAQFEVR